MRPGRPPSWSNSSGEGVEVKIIGTPGAWADPLLAGGATVDSDTYQDYAARLDEEDVLQWRFGPGYSHFHPVAESISTMSAAPYVVSGIDGPGNHAVANGTPHWENHMELGGQLCYLPDSGLDAGLALAIPSVVYRDPDTNPLDRPGVFDYRVNYTAGSYTAIAVQSNPDKAITNGGWNAIQGSTARIPIAAARARCLWPMAGIVAFKGGLIGVAACGNDANHTTQTGSLGFPAIKLGANKVPTACAMTLNREFALVTCWDTSTETGHLAVLAVEANPISDGEGAHFLGATFVWGLPNWGGLRAMKLLGYVDLPFKAPMMVEATADYSSTSGRGWDQNVGLSFSTQLERDWWHNGSGKCLKRAARAGYAIVASRAESKVCFIDLQPLYQYYRTMYFTTSGNYTLTQSTGAADSQWPYTFSFAPAQIPTIVTTLNINSPTSVLAGFARPWESYAPPYADMNTGNLSQFSSTTGTVSASTVQKQSGTHGLRVNPSGSTVSSAKINTSYQTSRSVRGIFGFYAATLPASGTVEIMKFFRTVDNSIIRLSSAGILTVLDRNKTVRGTGSTTITTGQWYRFEVLYVPATTSVAVTVKVNGVTDISASWSETPVSIDSAYFGALTHTAAVDLYFDNMGFEPDEPWIWEDEPYKHRAFVGTFDEGIKVYDVGNLVEEDFGSKDTPSVVTTLDVGNNINTMLSTYHSYTGRVNPSFIYCLSRGDNRIIELNGNTNATISTFRDSRIVDPATIAGSSDGLWGIQLGFFAVHVLDFSSKSVRNYVKYLQYTVEAAPAQDLNWYFGHSTTIPGKPIALSIAELP